MTTYFDRAVFERVFADAHVIDVDFSEWDKKISIWALADHYDNWLERCPTVVVEFRTVQEFACKMPPSTRGFDAPDKHLQWKIDDFEIQEKSSRLRVRLFGSESSPILVIECDSIAIRPVPTDMIDQVRPGWNRPYSGLARPGIEQLVDLKRRQSQR